jgi:hypothetical protein
VRVHRYSPVRPVPPFSDISDNESEGFEQEIHIPMEIRFTQDVLNALAQLLRAITLMAMIISNNHY